MGFLFPILLILTSIQIAKADIADYQVQNNTGTVVARFDDATVEKMLKEGNTCLKDGVRVLAKSKNITKKHCQKSKILGLRVIKASSLEVKTYKRLTGLK